MLQIFAGHHEHRQDTQTIIMVKRDVNPWRQHDTADCKGLVHSGSFNKLLSSRNTVAFIAPRLCRPHLIYRYNYIVSLPCPTWQSHKTTVLNQSAHYCACDSTLAHLNLASSPLSYRSIPLSCAHQRLPLISTLHQHNHNTDLTYT